MRDTSKSFWGGYRSEDVSKANGFCYSNDTPLKERWNKFTRSYYRLYNDGDSFHYGRLKGLAKFVGYELPYPWSDENSIDYIGDRLLDMVMEARKEAIASKDPVKAYELISEMRNAMRSAKFYVGKVPAGDDDPTYRLLAVMGDLLDKSDDFLRGE